MNKLRTMVYNSVAIAAMNAAFWVSNYYPRHILEFKSSVFISLLLTLFNIAHLLLMFIVVLLAFNKNSSIFSDHAFAAFQPRREAKKFFVLLSVQIGLDLVIKAVSGIVGEYAAILSDIALLINWLVVYVLLTPKNLRLYKNKKYFAYSFILLIIIFCAFLVSDLFAVSRYQLAAEKYQMFSESLNTVVLNLDFQHSLRLFALDSFIGVILVVFHMLNAVSEPEKKQKKRGITDVLRCAIILLVAFAFCGVKMIVCPDSSLHLTTGSSGTRSVQANGEGEFKDVKIKEIEWTRFSGTWNAYTDKTVCDAFITTIYYGQNKAAEIRSYGDPMYNYKLTETEVKKDYISFMTFGTDEAAASLYKNRVICWADNGKPRVLRFENIAGYEKNETLLKVCEELISQGNTVAFDYSAEYILKYDSKFVEPYLERYADGDFTQSEISFMNIYEYNGEYIEKLAGKLENKRINT